MRWDRELGISTGIDLVGIVLMFVYWFQFSSMTNIGGPQPIFGLIFPFVAYLATYWYHRDRFWTAFFLSFGVAVALAFIGVALVLYVLPPGWLI